MNTFEERPSNLGWYASHPWWWVRVLLMVTFGIVCAVFTVPIPAASTALFFWSLLALFVLASIYPLVTAYIATKLPSYLDEPWDRPQWTESPFAMHGPLHGPHFTYPILMAGAQGGILGSAYDDLINDLPLTYDGKMPQVLALFALTYGLWIGTTAAKGLFVDAYCDDLRTEADLSSRRTVEIAVGCMWLFVLVAIPVVALGIVLMMYFR